MLKRVCAICILTTCGLIAAPRLYSQTIGYATLTRDSGSANPTGTALFTYSDSQGVVLWQAGVAAVEPIRSGRIFVDWTAGTNSAIALANPSGRSVTANLVLRDESGRQIGAGTPLTLGPHEHRAKFVYELSNSIPQNVTIGSLSFETSAADQRLAAITLRESETFSGGGKIYTTLPVVDLDAPASTQPIVFPHLALGGGYTTQMILFSRSSGEVKGKIRMIRSDGTPFQLPEGSDIPYDIQPNGSFRIELTGGGDVQTGYAVVTLDQGDAIPSGSVIFQYKQGSRLVTEAGVGAIPATTKARIFIDRAGTETGIAIANAGNPASSVVLELMDRQGGSLGTATVDLPAGGQTPVFAYQLFPDMPQGFTGICEIRSTVPIVPITLKLTTNQRGDLILTTLPVADLTRTPPQGLLVFPQIAFGGGYSTRLILISTNTQQNSTGTLQLYQSSGSPLQVPLAGQTGSQFAYQVSRGAIRQLRPGNSATVQEIVFDLSNPDSSEIAVNEGNTLNLVPVALDSDQNARDDFQFGYTGFDSSIAAVDAQGVLQGKSAGFSTLAVSAGSVVKTVTINVVKINSGVSGGYVIGGVTQDLARRVYLANTSNQVILQMQNLSSAPERYAGVSQTSGWKDDLRLQSLFQRPSFLAADQAHGVIYVSDSGNNRIRRVHSGPDGRVDTLPADVNFNNPQGIALDSKGYLWVADTGSHTIKRINLSTSKVETIAGLAGSRGLADGTGGQARFDSPTGLAAVTETLGQQLLIESGGSPPPVTVIVADTGNNRVRRVTEDGKVETIGTAASSPLKAGRAAADSGAIFEAPTGVAADSLGNIYVTEPDSGQVKVILAATGQVVSAAQPGTIEGPRGIAVTQYGHVLIGSENHSGQEIAFGQPAITSISPEPVPTQGGTHVTIKGKNFSPETVVIAGGKVIQGLQVQNTETLSFTAPLLRSGRTIVTVQNRGGLAQTSLLVRPPSQSSLSTGSITTLAGGTTFAGEGAAATTGSVNLPFGLSLDSSGNLYVADTFNNRVRKIDALTGIMTTIAGTGVIGLDFQDGGPAAAADIAGPQGISIDAAGNLFIADTLSNRIRRVDAKTRIITTVAGQYLPSDFAGDGGPATSALLSTPKGVWVDPAGNLFIADTYNNRIRKVSSATGIITTIAGNGQRDYSGDNGPATGAALSRPEQVVVDSSGNIFIADTGNHRIRKVDASTQTITTYAGTGQESYGGDGGPAKAAGLDSPCQIAFDAAGNMFIADGGNARIRKITPAGVISTVAGSGQKTYGGDGGPATSAALASPDGVTVDGAGQIYISDTANFRIRRVNTSGIIETVAGNGHTSYLGDNGPAWGAALKEPSALATDAAGNVYIADQNNNRIRKVDAGSGNITTVAGSDKLGYSGDGGQAVQAGFSFPQGVAVDSQGNVFIADTLNNRIRKVDAATRVVTTVAGNGDDINSVDGVPATQSAVAEPWGITVDSSDNLLIAETGSHKIRRVDHATGIITTVAGIGFPPIFGDVYDGWPATYAFLYRPVAVAADKSGNIYIADSYNNRIRKVDTDGTISTVAGNGEFDYTGEGGPATAASLAQPNCVAVDASGNLYVSGIFNRVVRVDAVTGIMTSIAGTYGFGFSGDGGPAVNATFLTPFGLAFDPAGNLFIADQFNGRVRMLKGPVR